MPLPLSSPLGPPKRPHLAQALLRFLGLCVTGSHRAANEVQVVLGLLHLPWEKQRRLEQAMAHHGWDAPAGASSPGGPKH